MVACEAPGVRRARRPHIDAELHTPGGAYVPRQAIKVRYRVVRISESLKRGGAARAPRPEFGPAPQLMESLPEQHIEDLPAATREDAYSKVAKVFLLRRKGGDSEDEVAYRAGFGSADAMHHQLSAWGFAGLLLSHRAQPARKSKPREHKARGSGPVADLPPAGNAISIFQGTLEKLSDFVEQLSSRKEHRQGKRFVLSNAKPFLEVPEPGENRRYLEAPPDAQPDEHGFVSYMGGQAYVRVPGGAARHPDDELTAAIAAALLTGTSTDELLDALQWEPQQEVREQARVLFEGDTPSTRRDSFLNKARQIAALIQGYPMGRGDRTNTVTKEWQSAVWAASEWKGYGYKDNDIARRLNEQADLLPEFKKRRKVTVDDVRDLLGLEFKPY